MTVQGNITVKTLGEIVDAAKFNIIVSCSDEITVINKEAHIGNMYGDMVTQHVVVKRHYKNRNLSLSVSLDNGRNYINQKFFADDLVLIEGNNLYLGLKLATPEILNYPKYNMAVSPMLSDELNKDTFQQIKINGKMYTMYNKKYSDYFYSFFEKKAADKADEEIKEEYHNSDGEIEVKEDKNNLDNKTINLLPIHRGTLISQAQDASGIIKYIKEEIFSNSDDFEDWELKEHNQVYNKTVSELEEAITKLKNNKDLFDEILSNYGLNVDTFISKYLTFDGDVEKEDDLNLIPKNIYDDLKKAVKKAYPIGTTFKKRGKYEGLYTVSDVRIEYLMSGESYRIRYIAYTDTGYQRVYDYDVPAATIARYLINKGDA